MLKMILFGKKKVADLSVQCISEYIYIKADTTVAVRVVDITHGDICMKQTGKINTHAKLWAGWVTGDFPLSVVWNLRT